MAGTFERAEIGIVFQDFLVTTFDPVTGEFGSNIVQAAGPQNATLDFSVASGTLFGGGELLDIFSIVRGLEGGSLKLAGMDREIMAVMTGKVNQDNASNTALRGTSRQPTGQMPYLGMLMTIPTSDGGIEIIGIAGAKVDKPTPMSADGENPAYGSGTIPFKAISTRLNSQDASVVYETWYEDEDDFSFPTNASQFLAFFADIIPVPGPVTALNTGSITSTSIPVTWTRPIIGGAIDELRVEWNRDGNNLMFSAEVVRTANGYTITGLTSSRDYKIRVYAVNFAGDSDVALLDASTS